MKVIGTKEQKKVHGGIFGVIWAIRNPEKAAEVAWWILTREKN